jgi:hypothetical protein
MSNPLSAAQKIMNFKKDRLSGGSGAFPGTGVSEPKDGK